MSVCVDGQARLLETVILPAHITQFFDIPNRTGSFTGRKPLREISISSRASRCLMCGYVSRSRKCLYGHLKLDERSGVRHYSCCICRLPTLSKYFILKHVASHVKSGKSQCSEIGEDNCGDNCGGGNSSWYRRVSSYVWPLLRIGSCSLL